MVETDTKKMKDFFGNQLKIGDKVAAIIPRYRGLVLADIIAFTPQQVRIRFLNTWNYGREVGKIEETIQYPNQLIKSP